MVLSFTHFVSSLFLHMCVCVFFFLLVFVRIHLQLNSSRQWLDRIAFDENIRFVFATHFSSTRYWVPRGISFEFSFSQFRIFIRFPTLRLCLAIRNMSGREFASCMHTEP